MSIRRYTQEQRQAAAFVLEQIDIIRNEERDAHHVRRLAQLAVVLARSGHSTERAIAEAEHFNQEAARAQAGIPPRRARRIDGP